MAFYDRLVFLEHFDKENIIDDQAGIVEYELRTPEGFCLNFYINIHEGTVILNLNSNVSSIYSIGLYGLSKIICDTVKRQVCIFFYIPNNQNAAAILTIKPIIDLNMSTQLNKPF